METSTIMNVSKYLKEVKQPADEDSEFERLLAACAYRINDAVGRGRGRRKWIPEVGMERLPDEGLRLIFDAVAEGIREVLGLNPLLQCTQERELNQGTERALRLVRTDEQDGEPGGAA